MWDRERRELMRAGRRSAPSADRASANVEDDGADLVSSVLHGRAHPRVGAAEAGRERRSDLLSRQRLSSRCIRLCSLGSVWILLGLSFRSADNPLAPRLFPTLSLLLLLPFSLLHPAWCILGCLQSSGSLLMLLGRFNQTGASAKFGPFKHRRTRQSSKRFDSLPADSCCPAIVFESECLCLHHSALHQPPQPRGVALHPHARAHAHERRDGPRQLEAHDGPAPQDARRRRTRHDAQVRLRRARVDRREPRRDAQGGEEDLRRERREGRARRGPQREKVEEEERWERRVVSRGTWAEARERSGPGTKLTSRRSSSRRTSSCPNCACTA